MSNDMRKLMKIMESNDAIDRFPDDYAGDMEDLATTNLDGECPTCHDWGEILPPDVEKIWITLYHVLIVVLSMAPQRKASLRS